MKLKTRLLMFTAAAALSANMAFAAINPQTLADSYIAEGYTYVEIKVGPTQTKLEAVKGDRKVEVIYDNASGEIIKKEFDDVGDDYAGKTGVEIEDTNEDFADSDDENDDDQADEDGQDDDQNDDNEGDDSEDGDDDSGDGDDGEDGGDDSGGGDDGEDGCDDTGGGDDGEDGGDDNGGGDDGEDGGED